MPDTLWRPRGDDSQLHKERTNRNGRPAHVFRSLPPICKPVVHRVGSEHRSWAWVDDASLIKVATCANMDDPSKLPTDGCDNTTDAAGRQLTTADDAPRLPLTSAAAGSPQLRHVPRGSADADPTNSNAATTNTAVAAVLSRACVWPVLVVSSAIIAFKSRHLKSATNELRRRHRERRRRRRPTTTTTTTTSG
jgi:hypothetical protein